MNNTLEKVKQKLIEKEYRFTPQRKVILEIFSNNPTKHLSAEDVMVLVKKSRPEIGLATIYRTLELFADLEILHKIDFGDGRNRYELSSSNVHRHHHHHLICLKCGSVMECEDDLLEPLEHSIERKKKFTIVDHDLKFYGYCQKCKEKI